MIGGARVAEGRVGIQRTPARDLDGVDVIAGDGVMESTLKRNVDSDGLSGRVHFLGFRNDVEKVIAAFDIFALTSLWEGLPRVLVQAAALEKPIVTFNIEGASEMALRNA